MILITESAIFDQIKRIDTGFIAEKGQYIIRAVEIGSNNEAIIIFSSKKASTVDELFKNILNTVREQGQRESESRILIDIPVLLHLWNVTE